MPLHAGASPLGGNFFEFGPIIFRSGFTYKTPTYLTAKVFGDVTILQLILGRMCLHDEEGIKNVSTEVNTH